MFISSLIFVFLDRTKVALDGSQSKEICNPSTVHDRQLPLPEPAGGFLLLKESSSFPLSPVGGWSSDCGVFSVLLRGLYLNINHWKKSVFYYISKNDALNGLTTETGEVAVKV